MAEEKPVLTLHLPCVKFSFRCPYGDHYGRERDWTCCGLPGRLQKLVNMRECPALDVARAEYAKQKKGGA